MFFTRNLSAAAPKASRTRAEGRSPRRRAAAFRLETLEDRDLKIRHPPRYGTIAIQADRPPATRRTSIATTKTLRVTLNGQTADFDASEIHSISYVSGYGGWTTFVNNTDLYSLDNRDGREQSYPGRQRLQYRLPVSATITTMTPGGGRATCSRTTAPTAVTSSTYDYNVLFTSWYDLSSPSPDRPPGGVGRTAASRSDAHPPPGPDPRAPAAAPDEEGASPRPRGRARVFRSGALTTLASAAVAANAGPHDPPVRGPRIVSVAAAWHACSCTSPATPHGKILAPDLDLSTAETRNPGTPATDRSASVPGSSHPATPPRRARAGSRRARPLLTARRRTRISPQESFPEPKSEPTGRGVGTDVPRQESARSGLRGHGR